MKNLLICLTVILSFLSHSSWASDIAEVPLGSTKSVTTSTRPAGLPNFFGPGAMVKWNTIIPFPDNVSRFW